MAFVPSSSRAQHGRLSRCCSGCCNGTERKQRHPDGRARLFAGGDPRHHRKQHSGGEAALHRGRERLRAAAQEPDDAPPPVLSKADHARLAAYVDRFNARDFDAVRDMLADDVRLDLVSSTRMTGRSEVSRYFGNYASVHDWHLQPGFVDRHPAVIARDPSGKPSYLIVLQWTGGRVSTIRDFRHARYAIE